MVPITRSFRVPNTPVTFEAEPARTGPTLSTMVPAVVKVLERAFIQLMAFPRVLPMKSVWSGWLAVSSFAMASTLSCNALSWAGMALAISTTLDTSRGTISSMTPSTTAMAMSRASTLASPFALPPNRRVSPLARGVTR